MDDLTDALAATGATIAFDAIGGGKLAGQILTCMETAANHDAKVYSRYGSNVHKQVYIYGGLDPGPIELNRGFGMAWGVGGWLLFPFLMKISAADGSGCASAWRASSRPPLPATIRRWFRLPEALQLSHLAVYAKRATGEKYLINPNKGT